MNTMVVTTLRDSPNREVYCVMFRAFGHGKLSSIWPTYEEAQRAADHANSLHHGGINHYHVETWNVGVEEEWEPEAGREY